MIKSIQPMIKFSLVDNQLRRANFARLYREIP